MDNEFPLILVVGLDHRIICRKECDIVVRKCSFLREEFISKGTLTTYPLSSAPP